jgi:tRNA-specific 2-thiouridylase
VTFDLPPASRVVVAMSGGVDSAVAAGLLAEAGHDVVGVTLQLYDHGAATAGRAGACCAGRDIADAREAAERLGVAHYVLDFEERFRRAVIDDFAESYARGATPVPCVRCNQRIKFRDLADVARDLGAAALATGHYADRRLGPAGPELHRARDTGKDQSYFLFATTPGQLAFLRFPLGRLTKAETRAHAGRLGLGKLAEKAESQDICFVPSGHYSDLVARLRPEAMRPGEIVHASDGRVLGRHDGAARFTVGQRRGLGVAAADGEPLYVVEVDAGRRRVVAGPRAAGLTEAATLAEVNWLGDAPPPEAGVELAVQHRYKSPPVAAKLLPGPTGGGAKVRFASPEPGVAPGQACVLYDGTRLLGGGWIADVERVAPATVGGASLDRAGAAA